MYSRILAVNEEIVDSNSVYTYFVDEVTRQVLADLSEIKGFNETQAHWLLFSGGLSIYTTLDPDIFRQSAMRYTQMSQIIPKR